jgi:hypothetical protein
VDDGPGLLAVLMLLLVVLVFVEEVDCLKKVNKIKKGIRTSKI